MITFFDKMIVRGSGTFYFRFKLCSVVTRWVTQITRSPKPFFHLRAYYHDENIAWETLLKQSFRFVKTVDRILTKFFSQGFTKNNINGRKTKLESEFREAIHLFPNEVSSKVLKNIKMDPKVKDYLLRRVPEIVVADISNEVVDNAESYAKLVQLISENNGRDLKPHSTEVIFQSCLTITGMEIKDNEPQVASYRLPYEKFTGNLTMSMAELFSSGIILRIHDDIRPELWSYFVKNLVHDNEASGVYPVLNRMIRKNRRQTARNSILPVCQIMLKVNPRFEGNLIVFQKT